MLAEEAALKRRIRPTQTRPSAVAALGVVLTLGDAASPAWFKFAGELRTRELAKR